MIFYYIEQKIEIRYESFILTNNSTQSFSTSLPPKYLVVFICRRNEKH